MAVELCSDNSGISPRISFSHDLCLSDVVPIEPHPLPSNSSGSIEFDFCVRKSFDQDSSSADELFSDGKILPTEVKKKTGSARLVDPSSTLPQRGLHDDVSTSNEGSKTEMLKETSKTTTMDEPEEKQGSSRSFWRFKRSSSLNCGSSYSRSLCPLPLLSRSNSTGSAPSMKRAPLSKDNQSMNHKQHKQPFMKSLQSTASTSHQKPPLKKNYGAYGSGVRVNPVLNVPSGNLFGLGSIFSNGKDKNKKK
ncbi:hypothetical protein K2173_001236 [Erythroxylum novogranatense]|uniref:Uncharacterized protein n=1 Tax=Erythroxylum novogranatense TaxID=1862640 RepID=A0AAV8T4J9_9ROSI|nr:hypothetical protein K2173_001236 [Erythroxylum novogranatense]